MLSKVKDCRGGHQRLSFFITVSPSHHSIYIGKLCLCLRSLPFVLAKAMLREADALASCMSALDPSATSALLKAPGAGLATAGVARKARPSIKALQPEKPPPFTPVPGVPPVLATVAATSAANAKPAEEDDEDAIRVPGVIPSKVLPLQSESSAGTVPRYSTALEKLLSARGERTTARLGFKGLGDSGAAEVCESQHRYIILILSCRFLPYFSALQNRDTIARDTKMWSGQYLSKVLSGKCVIRAPLQ